MSDTFYLQPKFTGTTGKVLKFNSSGGLDAVDAPSSAIKPLVKVFATTGSTVIISYNGTTYRPTEQSGTGVWYQELPYTGYSATVTATKSGTTLTETVDITISKMYYVEIIAPIEYKPVGGRIFYDAGENGASYKFFDASKTEITDISISGLADAVYYAVEGTPDFDRWYVYDNTSHTTGNKTATNGLIEST